MHMVAHAHTYTYTNKDLYACTQQKHKYAQTNKKAHTHACTCVHMHARTRTCTRSLIGGSEWHVVSGEKCEMMTHTVSLTERAREREWERIREKESGEEWGFLYRYDLIVSVPIIQYWWWWGQCSDGGVNSIVHSTLTHTHTLPLLLVYI